VLTIPPSTKLWFASRVDLRLGFDGLANLVRSQLDADPLSGHLFVFTNRSADRVKLDFCPFFDRGRQRRSLLGAMKEDKRLRRVQGGSHVQYSKPTSPHYLGG
jgi:hypothetical protein